MTPKHLNEFAAQYIHPYTSGMIKVPVSELRDIAYSLTAALTRAETAEREREVVSALARELQDDLAELFTERDAARAEQRDILDRLARLLDACSEERYQELKSWEAQARRWESEGDMYGWNFHQGMAAGANWCDIIYRQLGREIETIRKEAKAILTPQPPAEET